MTPDVPAAEFDPLTQRVIDALLTDYVAIELTYTIIPWRAALSITIPGATPRSKRVSPVPLIIADEGMTHADLLRAMATMMDRANGVESHE